MDILICNILVAMTWFRFNNLLFLRKGQLQLMNLEKSL